MKASGLLFGINFGTLVLCAPACSIYTQELLQGATGAAGNTSGTGANSSGGQKSSAGGDNSGGSGADSSTGGATVSTGGTGGESNTGGSNTGGNPGTGGLGGAPSYEPIDDMEDNEPTILPRDGRNGRWNVYNDGSAGTQTPSPDFSTMHELMDSAPELDSSYSAYTSGGGFSTWGAVLNVSMRSWPTYEETPPYDATAYSGMAFYAKVGADSTSSIRVRLVTTDTDPRGGNCLESGDTSELCFDHFAHSVTLSTDWQFVELSFDDFVQSGSGKQFSKPALDGLYSLEFVVSAGTDFELWVDDPFFIEN